MSAAQLMLSLVEQLPANAIVVDEGITSTQTLLSLLPMRDKYAYFGNMSGGIGWGIAAAVGIQAARPERRVIAIIGDGSAMYSIQALWTAANQKLPVIFVLANNGGYQIIKQRLKAFHGSEHFIGMDFVEPTIDSVGLATSFGVHAVKVSTTEAFAVEFAAALGGNAPVLIEAMVQPSV